jgi:hypothetical protein
MSARRIRIAAASVALMAISSASAWAGAAGNLVKSLYAEQALAFDAAKSGHYFTADLDAALRADHANPDEVGAVDFDYRYGGQDGRITGLQFVEDTDRGQSRVVAVFKNDSRPHSVDWYLCRRTDGSWRIADASSNTGAEPWGMRMLLHLPLDRVVC